MASFTFKILAISFLLCTVSSQDSSSPKAETTSEASSHERKPEEHKLYTIEGRIDIDNIDVSVWGPKTRVLVDGGRFVGYVKGSGEFQVVGIPSGSYTVEVASPNHVFDVIRVDISGKTGKIRARKLNLLKPNAVAGLPYPLKFHTSKQADFFQKRESWNIISIIRNPMVLIMVAPVLLMLLMPKLMNSMDKDTQKDMQQSMQAFQQPGSNMPSIEEMFTNFFGGGASSSTKKTNKTLNNTTKKQKH